MNNKPHAATINIVKNVYSVLPSKPAPGIDYETLRGRVRGGLPEIRRAMQALIAQNKVEARNDGMRHRKLFRRVEEGTAVAEGR